MDESHLPSPPFEETKFWANIPMFETMSEDALRELRRSMEEILFAAGDTIIRQGDEGDRMFLLVQGRVRITITNERHETHFERVLDAPTLFGEMALITHEPRNATVTAASDVVCLMIDKEGFEDLIGHYPKVAAFLTRAVGDRLRESDNIRQVGKYRIVGHLGAGAVATVFEARHPDLNRSVAVKMLSHALVSHQGFREHFATEGRLVAQLEHPNIVRVFDTEHAYGTLFIVMEKLNGAILSDAIKEGATLSWDAIRDILRETALALQCSHEQGLIHRDVKPSNLFLTEQGQAKLLDFGIAVQEERSTSNKQRVGTPYYMSPEQLRGQQLDGRSDLYALGIMAYELICGHVPFDADNLKDLLRKHLVEPVPDPRATVPGVPLDLVTLIAKATRKNPDHRYASCGEAATFLQEAAELPEVHRMALTSVGILYPVQQKERVEVAAQAVKELLCAREGVAVADTGPTADADPSSLSTAQRSFAISAHPSRTTHVQECLAALQEDLASVDGVHVQVDSND